MTFLLYLLHYPNTYECFCTKAGALISAQRFQELNINVFLCLQPTFKTVISFDYFSNSATLNGPLEAIFNISIHFDRLGHNTSLLV